MSKHYYIHIIVYDRTYEEFKIEGVFECNMCDLNDSEFDKKIKEYIVKKALTTKHCLIQEESDITKYTITSITKL